MSKKKKEKVTSGEKYIRDIILWFYKEKKTKEACEKSFDEAYYDFKQVMERYYDKYVNEDGRIEIDVIGELNNNISKLLLKKVQPTSVEWDCKKLKEIITDKKQRQLVFSKNYEVINWTDFMEFLNSKGIKYKEFLEYVNVKESVRDKQLDKLIDLGLVDEENTKKCSKVIYKAPYYKLTEK